MEPAHCWIATPGFGIQILTLPDLIAAINALEREQLSPLLIAIAARMAAQPSRTSPDVPPGNNAPTHVDADTLAAARQLKKSQLMTLARQKKISITKIGKYVGCN